MTQFFQMPAYCGELFEDHTVFAFEKAYRDIRANGYDLDFIQFLFYIPDDDRGERCIPEKDVRFVSGTLSDSLNRMAGHTGSVDTIHAAWGRDRLIEQAIPALPLPWKSFDMGPRLAGKYLALHWSPDVVVIAQEHIPTFLLEDDSDPLGSGWAQAHRSALACTVMPPCDSAHGEIAAFAKSRDVKVRINRLWALMTLGITPGIDLDLGALCEPVPLH